MGRSRVLTVLAALGATVGPAIVVPVCAAHSAGNALPHAARVRHCPSITIYRRDPKIFLTTTRTRCATARRLVFAWRRRLSKPHTHCLWRDGSDRPGICTVDRWHCRSYHTTNGQNYPVVCERRPRRVRFVVPL
jgi:hypothetical protein